MKRKGRRGRDSNGNSGKRGSDDGGGYGRAENEVQLRLLTLLHAAPATIRTPENESVFSITVSGLDGSIEIFAFSMRDTMAMVTGALISLSHEKNEFASYLLTKYFMHDNPHLKDEGGGNDL